MLLLYGQSTLARGARSRVRAHLADCDFCGAEIHLLTRHAARVQAQAANLPETVAIPAGLHRLALDLLAEPSRTLTILAELIFERERLTLTDA